MFKRVMMLLVSVCFAIGLTVSVFADFLCDYAEENGIPFALVVDNHEKSSAQTSDAPETQRLPAQTFRITHVNPVVPDQEVSTSRAISATRIAIDDEVEALAIAEEAVIATDFAKTEEAVVATESAEEWEEEEVAVEPAVEPLKEGTIIDPSWDESTLVLEDYTWEGNVIDSYIGTVKGPNGKETYYNLDMTGVIWIMEDLGYDYEYSVREDGVKMYGPFIMVAADLDLRPRGSIIKTSLGWAMVCDTGAFTQWNPTQLDIAVTW